MSVRVTLCAVLLAMIGPRAAEACSCGGTSPVSASYRAADVVFLARVVGATGGEAIWKTGPEIVDAKKGMVVTESQLLGFSPTLTTFEVSRVFRGAAGPRVVLPRGGSTCDFLFNLDETWLIYARQTDQGLRTDKCKGTKLRSDAALDLLYLEGVAQGRQQGIVYGVTRVLNSDGICPAELRIPNHIVAVGGGRRIDGALESYGEYQLVLPPGDFELSVLDADGATIVRQSVRVANGDERRLDLIVE
jgi:hypothetical protein